MMRCVRRLLLLCLLLPSLAWGQATVINGNRVHAGWTNYGITTGTATAYGLTFSPPLPGYVAGQCFVFRPHLTNTGPATLNVQGLGAKNFSKRSGSSLVPLVAGDLLGQQLMQACYDGTDLQLMGAAPEAASTGVTDADKGDITVTSGGTVWTIDTGAVSYSKLPLTTAPSVLLGRGSTGPGTWEQVTLGTGLAMSGTQLTATSPGVTDTDKGDITVSSGGTVWTIDNTVVTFLKMQNVTSGRVLGRNTAGAGPMEELTAAMVKTMLGITFGDITTGGPASDAQIPDLNTLSTGLTVSRCVETDSTGKLGVAAGLCGTTGATTGITGATNHGLMVATGGTTGSSLGVAANGQIPIGAAGADPVLAVPGGTGNQIQVTPGAGSLVFSFPPAGVTLPGTTTLTNPLAVASGGSGASTLTGLVVGNGTAAMTGATTSADIAAVITGETGSAGGGLLVFNQSPTLLTPNIASTDFTNAQHAHTAATSGGQLTDAALSAAVGVAKGGTGLTTSPDDTVMVGNGAAWQAKALPSCDAANQALQYTLATNLWGCATIVSSGSSIILDLGDNGLNESNALGEVATVGSDAAGVFTMPLANKLLIDLTKKWPTPPAFGDLSGIPTALDDGATKGIAAFVANDFNCTAGGVCSLDYTNGPESVARKNASAFLGSSNIDYPTQGAVKAYVDTGTKEIRNTAIVPRPCAANDVATISINADNLTGCDFVQVAQLSQPTTFDLDPGKVYVNGQFLSLLIFTTTQRGLTFTTGAGKFASEGMLLPTFTRAGGYVLYGFRFNALSNRWALVASNQTTTYASAAGQVLTSGVPGVEPSWQAPTGGVTLGDKTDITVSTVTTPADTWAIDPGAVTYTKMQNVTASRLLGRGDSGTGVPQELLVGSGLSLTGTTLTATGGLAGSIGTIHLPMSGAQPPLTGGVATFDNSKTNGRLLFDASTSECAVWGPFRMNSDYASTPVFKFQYSMTSATTNGVAISVSVMTEPASGAADLNNDALYGAVNTCTQTPVPATLGAYKEISCPLTNNDGMAANRLTKIKLCRATADAVDTATGDMEGLTASMEYTR